MSQRNPFRKALKGVDSAIKQGTARALNRALSSTKTKLVRQLREDTGLKTEVIKTRLRARKAKQDRLGAILGIAVKFGIALSKFSPSLKRVKALYKDGSKRNRTGITVKMGKGPRQLVPGAFPLDNKSGAVVVGRKAAYDAQGKYVDSTTQGTLTTLKSQVFTESAKASHRTMVDYMRSVFERIVGHEIDFAVSKRFDANK